MKTSSLARSPHLLVFTAGIALSALAMQAAAASAAVAAPERAAAPAEGRYVDQSAGFSLAPPPRWRPVDPASYAVPGTLRAGWSPDSNASILVFTTHLAEPVNASFLLAQHQAAAKRTRGAKVEEERTFMISGMRAMSFIFTAPGTGGAVESSGTEPTTQHWVAIPHQREVLFLLLTCHEAASDLDEATFQTVLSSLDVAGTQTDDQSLPR